MVAGRLFIEVLGPLRVWDEHYRELTPAGELQRRLLALLVLRRGRVVSVDVASDALWPERLPQDPAAALQTHVFRLRRALPDGLVESAGDGYRLDPARVMTDADWLQAAVAELNERSDAPWTLDTVLRGSDSPAFAAFEDLDDARVESRRLDELRRGAREIRAERRLAHGDLDGLLAELTSLAEAEPFRERPRQLLMQALAASGRRVDALRVYDDFRRLLGDQLGIEPSPLLAEQHAGLLAGDSPGAPPPPPPSAPAAAAPQWSSIDLPTPLTSLIGRDEILDEVAAQAERHRLVTLVGPGGVGKTTLAVAVGHRLRAAHPDRPTVLCELAAADVESATKAIGAALGIEDRPGTLLAPRIASLIGDARVSMILDNCEHVLTPVADLVDRVLRTCPNVNIVATSRERLRVAGERVVAVPPLLSAGGSSPAVELFVERAAAVRPVFSPDDAERALIADIARRLDGLPLAIELAAACLHTHDLNELAVGLDQRFALLAAGPRASERHASLGAAVQWSYALLDDALQGVFRALAVFAGSFGIGDAAAVAGLSPSSATSALTQLTERSLVQRTHDRRYVLLETLRMFAVEQLALVPDELAAVGERHAHHMVLWAAREDAQLAEPGKDAIASLDLAIPELSAALTWLLDHEDHDRAGQLLGAVLHYGFLRLRPDVLAWSGGVVAADPDDLGASVPHVRVAAAYAAWMGGDIDAAAAHTERALAVAGRDAVRDPSPKVLTACGTIALLAGRLQDAAQWYRDAVRVAGDDAPQRIFSSASELLPLGYSGDPAAASRAERLLAEIGEGESAVAAYIWYCAGEAVLDTDVPLARRRLTRAVALAERTGAAFVTGAAGASKASLEMREGDLAKAAEEYRWLLDHWRRAGIWATQWTMLRSVAGLLHRLGRFRRAAVLLGAVRAPRSGQRVFGADEVALTQLEEQLRAQLGHDEYESAIAEGRVLDGDAAVEHALRAL